MAAGTDYAGPEGPVRWRNDLIITSRRAHEPPLLLEEGHYAEQLQRYLDLFGRPRLHVLFTEELGDDAKLRDLLSFLDVGAAVVPPVQRRSSAWLERTRRPGILGVLGDAARRGGLHRLLGSSLREPLREALTERRPAPELDPEIERRLDEYFAPHNRRLAALLGRSLSRGWPT